MGSVIGKFTGKCCDSNVFNNNDMHLGREVFETLMASEEYQRAMKNRHYVGYLGHPSDPDCQDDQNACIVMTDMKLLDNGEIEGDFDLVDTPVGRIVKSFVDAGVNYGISIRGVGDVDSNGEVDPDQFIFRGFDLVRFPAYDDCIVEFKAIAASTDVKKKAKYKKVCASIDNNIKDITSCEALEIIKEQLPDGSDEFNKIQDRIDELAVVAEPSANVDDEIASVMEQKLEAMTELYLDAAAKVSELEKQLVESQLANQELIIECKSMKHKQTRLNKIVANQIKDSSELAEEMEEKYIKSNSRLNALRNKLSDKQDELDEVRRSYDDQVLANTKLKEKLNSVSEKRKDDLNAIKASEDLNLKYQQKIEANSEAISQRDSAIEELKQQINETVVANKKLESKASNLDEKNGELLSRVEAAEEMVSSYQQAYANLYANALGVYRKDLVISASTSVEELKEMINAGTSTANIAAAPDYYSGSLVEDDLEDEDYFDDNTQYSADLVTL